MTQQFLKAGLLDEIQVSVVPTLLSDGVRLLANLADHQLDLQCTRVDESDGVTHLRYRFVKKETAGRLRHRRGRPGGASLDSISCTSIHAGEVVGFSGLRGIVVVS